MIQLSGAGKRFGHKLLFEDLDWLITPNDRVGVVGANGTGKGKKAMAAKVAVGTNETNAVDVVVHAAEGGRCQRSDDERGAARVDVIEREQVATRRER